MATVLAPPAGQRVRLSGISWETYERLLAEHEGRQSPRFTYDRGELEIMVISFEHEESNRLLDHLFSIIADERGIDFVDAGSTTLIRRDLDRGSNRIPVSTFETQRASVGNAGSSSRATRRPIS